MDNTSELKGNDVVMKSVTEVLENPLECPVCRENLDSKNRLPMVGNCGHSICRMCCDVEKISRCPVCQNGKFVKHAQTNYSLASVLERLEKTKNKFDDVKHCITKSCFLCVDCEYPIAEYLAFICEPCGVEKKLLHYDHENKLKIQNDVDSSKIERSNLHCLLCSKDGAHKNHKVVRYLPLKLNAHELIATYEDFEQYCSDVFKDVKMKIKKMTELVTSVCEKLDVGTKKIEKNVVSFQEFEDTKSEVHDVLSHLRGYIASWSQCTNDLLVSSEELTFELNEVYDTCSLAHVGVDTETFSALANPAKLEGADLPQSGKKRNTQQKKNRPR